MLKTTNSSNRRFHKPKVIQRAEVLESERLPPFLVVARDVDSQSLVHDKPRIAFFVEGKPKFRKLRALSNMSSYRLFTLPMRTVLSDLRTLETRLYVSSRLEVSDWMSISVVWETELSESIFASISLMKSPTSV